MNLDALMSPYARRVGLESEVTEHSIDLVVNRLARHRAEALELKAATAANGLVYAPRHRAEGHRDLVAN